MVDYVACIIVKFLNILARVIPISVSLWIARRLGSIAFFVNRKRRLIAYANLRSAFCKEKSPSEIRRITKMVYQNMAQTFVEIINLTKVNKAYVDRYVKIDRLELMKNAAASGRGTILLTAHFGDWELSSLTSAVIGFPILVLAREQKMRRLNELLNRLRESKGCKVIRKGMSTKNLLRALYSNKIVGILSDQDAGKNGVFVDFFDRPTSTHSGPAEMAKRANAIILPNFIVRTKGPYHEVCLEDYIDPADYQGEDGVRQMLQKFATLLESRVRKNPEQWLWLHKRWKSTSVRNVMVLNDGRAGHLNQALAVAQQLRLARTYNGYKTEDTRISVIDVHYKSDLFRLLLKLLTVFAGWRSHGRMWQLKLCLKKDCYDALMKSYADFVISCGSKTVPVNILMSIENNAKNVVAMKPESIFATGRFNLIVAHHHDRIKSGKNVVKTDLVPNLVNVESMKRDLDRVNKIFNISSDRRYLGVLIGGDNPEFVINEELAGKIIDELLDYATLSGRKILLTTSRRTNAAVDALIKRRLKDDPRCALLVIANEKNVEGAVGAILSLADVIVVSGESMSMVSEAVSSGKKIVVFIPKKKEPKYSKHEESLNMLKEKGYLDIADISAISQTCARAASLDTVMPEPEDAKRVVEALRRII